MKHLKQYNLYEASEKGTLMLSKSRIFYLLKLILKTEIKEINNSEGKLEVVYFSKNADVSELFPHMKKASFEYTTVMNSHWAEAEIKAWDPYEINNRKVYILTTGKYKRKTSEYQAMVHIFMKHLIDSGRQIQY
jgi:hypothetical protein